MILTYLLIGVIFTLFIDVIINLLSNNNSFPNNVEWGNLERIFCILLWPMALVIFIGSFLVKYFNL